MKNFIKDKKIKKRPKKEVSLSKKLVNIISVILLLVLTAIIFTTYKGLDLIYLAYSAVKTYYAAGEIEKVFESGDSDDFSHQMDIIERSYELNIEIYNKNNQLVYSSAYKGEMSNPPYDENTVILPPFIQKDYEMVVDLGSSSNNAFNLSRDTENGANTEYLVCTWHTEDNLTFKLFKLKTVVDSTAQLTVIFISVISFILISIALIVIIVFVRRTVKPLNDMSNITEKMAMLDFSHKCSPSDITEISILANSINNMSDALKEALADLRQKNKKLQEDIEQEKTIDQLRQVFISGASHELKTPIAIIQGYAEGLQMFLDSDPETAKNYCDIIISETGRMNNLVMKLLDIIKYESGEYTPSYEAFNLFELIEDWLTRNSEILKEKGITSVNTVNSDFIAYGDSFILSTVVNNYLSNAVSHVCGDMIIKVSAEEIDGCRYRVSIFNTGIPIAAKDIGKIWDNFYRADKAMSRSQGRFGLGLAIVASIQKLHKQDYGVINHEDGVEFWFDVKKYDSEQKSDGGDRK